MKRLTLLLLALLSAACIGAMPFLCAHSNLLPEVSTAYYEQKAQAEALSASGPEAELMRLLLGNAAVPTEPTASKPAFTVYGLVLALGTVAALAALFIVHRPQHELRTALLWTSVLAVPMGLIGARLVYCLVNLSFYVQDIAAPEAMLKVWEGGLSLSGGLVFAVLAGVIGAKIAKAPVGRVLNALTPALFVLILTGCGAACTVHMGYGPEMAQSLLTVSINGTPRLNTACLVMAVLTVAFGIALLCLRRTSWPAGQRFALYAFLYGTVMILLESLRKDGHMVWGFVHAEMLFDLFFALAALLYLAKTRKHILLALFSTLLLAGAVIALEFALDRSAIGDGWLYLLYAAVIGTYLSLGCYCAKKRNTV